MGREVIIPSLKERWKLWGDPAARSFNVRKPVSVKAMRSPRQTLIFCLLAKMLCLVASCPAPWLRELTCPCH